jgi:hypothetical protein
LQPLPLACSKLPKNLIVGQGVVGSNPVIPTNCKGLFESSDRPFVRNPTIDSTETTRTSPEVPERL